MKNQIILIVDQKKNIPFFYKLKEKNKRPSKTPYLDKKFSNSSYDVTKYVNNKTHGKSVIKKKEFNMPLFSKMKSSKIEINHFKTNENKKELNVIKKGSDKKLLVNNKKDINIIMNNKNTISEKGEKKKYKNNNTENKIFLHDKKEGKSSCNIIVNILNKPFFCCLKS